MVAAIALAALCFYAYRDRSPGYSLAIHIDGQAAAAQPQQLLAGFGRGKITPDLTSQARPVWLAGFSQNRAATRVHDDLWALATVIDDGQTRLGIVALDAIGLFHDDVVAIRQRLGRHLELDYAIICTTHNHSTPDLMGLWGPHPLKTGVDLDYKELVITAAARALEDAVGTMAPARLSFHEVPLEPEGLLTDTREPKVYDPNLRVMHFTHFDGSTFGSIVTWANHPETPWSRNTEITADFPGYLRDALENGLIEQDKVFDPGLGGTHLYINGAIGGLMTTSPSVTVHDPIVQQDFKEPSHEKGRALGRQLAIKILPLLRGYQSKSTNHAPISIRARTLEMPVSNKLFLLAPLLGVVNRGYPSVDRWTKLRTEVALVTVGDASIACIPGEIYPELVNGGVERVPGADFRIEPLEVPAIRDLMPGRIKFVFGLANDEIGYIIPKSQWDQKPPHLYGSSKPVYGEINSVSPDAAFVIHNALREFCGPFRTAAPVPPVR
jgi:hypothetical protein